MLMQNEDWFQKAFPKRAIEMPPALIIKLEKEYILTFKEKRPRVVSGGFRRLTPVINIECEGKPYSLYLSHVDLARRVRLLEKKNKSLLDLSINIKKKKGPKRNYLYDVKEII